MEEYSSRKEFFGFVAKCLVFVVLIALLLFIATYVFNWVTKPLVLTDPERIEDVSKEANNAYQALQSAKASIENIDAKMLGMIAVYGEDKSSWPQGKDDEYLQLVQQHYNLVTAYNNQCAAYKANWKNEWWEISAPKDLPTSCDLIVIE